jgi:hypothetical protein
MTMYSGDEFYDDDVTSGPAEEFDDDHLLIGDDDMAGEFDDVAQGRYDFD